MAHEGRARAAGSHRRLGSVEGIVSAHRAGYGFVRVEGQDASVFLPPPQMAGLMPGDRVRVTMTRAPDGRYAGEVQAVLAHGVSAFLGSVELQGRAAFVDAVDRRLALRCFIPPTALHGAKGGDWVIARITRYPGAASGAQAQIEKVLDPHKPLELATEAAIARNSLPVEFPPEVLREAAAFGAAVDPAESARRIDLRALPLVTIDGADARDFDDAVWCEEVPQGWRLIVAIADVSHYVRPGSALDAEASARGTSVYFPRRVLPMLPQALSDHLCSLAPHVDRLCFAADMQVSRAGVLKAARFYPAVMRSHARLTYDQAYAALFEGRPTARDALGDLLPRLRPLVDVYRALEKARHRRGALDFDTMEPIFEFDSEGAVKKIDFYARNDAHRLIEECMILANVAVAAVLKENRIPTLFRVHAQPEQKKLDQLLAMLTALGIGAEIPDEPEPRDLRAITERLGNLPERPFVESLVVRSMQQALYQPVNIGHFGLALKDYSHFTSPIRRYPDLIAHRSLRAFLQPSDPGAARYSQEQLAALGTQMSQLEKRADESDRYVDTFLKCTWLRERIGQVFNGLVTTVAEFGCFIQIVEVGVDGLMHVDNFGSDDFVLSEDGHAWESRHTHKRLRIGTQLRVIVTNANPIEGLVDLAPAPEG